MKTTILAGFALLATGNASAQEATYFPPRGEWERRSPEDVGMDPAALAEAVTFVRTRENQGSKDLESYIRRTLGNEPHGDIIGPVKDRGEMNGLVIRNGYIVAITKRVKGEYTEEFQDRWAAYIRQPDSPDL